jgi:PPP family 3-phenylpropionic acid transporter
LNTSTLAPAPHATRWAALYYFSFFAAIGVLVPYINLYFKSVGLDTGRIGILAALPTVVSLVASPLWGVVADRLRLHKVMLPVAMVSNALIVFLLLQSQQFVFLAIFVLLQSFFGSPIGPMADNSILEMLGEKGRHRYGSMRLWGAIGFGITSWLIGNLIDRTGLGIIAITYPILFVISAWVAAHLPAPRFIAPPKFHDLKNLLRNVGWRGLLISMFFMGLAASIHSNYFVLYLQSIGAPSSMFGTALVVASVSELIMFLLVPKLIQRKLTRAMIIAGFLAWIARELLCALVRDPVLASATQALHGLAFSALWTATITLARDLVPPGWGATAQGLLASVAWGAAWGLGALLGGQLLQWSGATVMFVASALCAAVGLIVFLVSQHMAQAGAIHAPAKL